MDISVSIVYYKVPELLLKCIESVYLALNGLDAEIIVVDNHSQDNGKSIILSQFPEVQWIENSQNLGFGRAHNQAVKLAQGEYIVILNPDTELKEGIFQNLLEFSKNKPKLGVVGVQMRNLTDAFLPESKRNIPGILNAFEKELHFSFLKSDKSYYAKQVQENEIVKVPVLSGAFMWIKRKVYEDLGGFDERYFMYAEDIDLSMTALEKGYENYYKGDIVIRHLKGESARKNEQSQNYFYTSMKQFIEKRYSNYWKKMLYQAMVDLARYKQKVWK